MKLTWNQQRALANLSARASHPGSVPREIADAPWPSFTKYLCGSAARSALMSLARKGLAECVPTSPLRYRITDSGRNALKAEVDG